MAETTLQERLRDLGVGATLKAADRIDQLEAEVDVRRRFIKEQADLLRIAGDGRDALREGIEAALASLPHDRDPNKPRSPVIAILEEALAQLDGEKA